MHELGTTTTDIILSRAINRKGEVRLKRVPNTLYQIFFDIAQQPESIARRRVRIFKALKDWLDESYPGYGLVQFEDYNNEEAEEMNRKLKAQGHNYSITWGMYVLLVKGAQHMQLHTDLTQVLDQPNNAIEDGHSLLSRGNTHDT